jgi:hypothetical protein
MSLDINVECDVATVCVGHKHALLSKFLKKKYFDVSTHC